MSTIRNIFFRLSVAIKKNLVYLQHGNRPEQNKDVLSTGNDSNRMAVDPAGIMEVDRDRSYIRVYEKTMASGENAYSEHSQRDRRKAESQRLVALARKHGQFFERNKILSLGIRYSKSTGESEIVIDHKSNRVYKLKDPFAKSPLKKNVQPEDMIYEHIIHNLYFPETRYHFVGISEEYGEIRIILSQEFIDSVGQPTQKQIDSALVNKGLLPAGKYCYENNDIIVTDVSGDNALLGADGNIYFIDPIINFKRSALDIIRGFS